MNMTKGKMREVLNGFKQKVDKNKPAIYAGTAIAGVILTGLSAYQAGKKVTWILQNHRNQWVKTKKDPERHRELAVEIAKELAPAILPPVIIGGATIACIFCSNKESSKRIATLSAAYAISEKSLKELNTKMEDSFGLKKVQKLKEDIAKDHVKDNPPPVDDKQIIITGEGDVLCMDSYTGRYFRSNAQKIGQAINELSYECASDMFVSLNEFYEKIGIPCVRMGEDLGWNAENMMKGTLPITYTAVLTSDDRPCLVVEYDASLRTDYRNLH